MKRCPKCKTEKYESCFGKSSSLPSGLSCWCKQCDKKKRDEYRSRPEVQQKTKIYNKDYLSRPEVKKARKEYNSLYSKNNPEKGRIKSKRWYRNHTDRIRADYVKNKDVYLARHANYRNVDRDRYLRVSRANHLKRKYGLTPDQCSDILRLQANKCKICGSEKPGKKDGNWSVDHDHQTGKIRGMLCRACNLGLGLFKDNPEILRKAAAYLEASKTVTMPTEEVLRG